MNGDPSNFYPCQSEPKPTMIRLSGSTDIDEGFDAIWRADFDRAVALLHNVDAPGCSTMRSRAYLRMGLAKRAVAEYEHSQTLRLHPREHAEMVLLAVGAYRLVGDTARSVELASDVERIATELKDPSFDLLCLTVDSVREMTRGNLAASKSAAERGLRLSEKIKNREPAFNYCFEVNHLRARLLESMGIHASLVGDHDAHERYLADAVLTSTYVRRRDVFAEVNLLSNLSTIIARYHAPRARDLVFARMNSIVWNDHLEYNRSYIKRCMRSSKEIFGFSESIENFGGRGYATLAARLGDSVDRLLGSHWADRAAFDAELTFAIELTDRVDWNDTPGEELSSLPLLAALAAARNVESAERIMEIYAREVQALCRSFVFYWDGRRPAIERFAEASIAKARGDFATALEKHERSKEFWSENGIGHRAALVGIERYTMSRDTADLAPAAAFLRAFPNTPFARRLGSAFERTTDAAPGGFPFLMQGVPA